MEDLMINAGFYLAGSLTTVWIYKRAMMNSIIRGTLEVLAQDKIIDLVVNSEGVEIAQPVGLTQSEREEMMDNIIARIEAEGGEVLDDEEV